MLKIKKVTFLLILLALVAYFAPAQVSAQGMKIGFVKDDRIQLEYKAFQKAKEQWELDEKAWEEEAVNKQVDLQELETEFEKQKLILSEDKKREKEASINVKRDDLDAYTRRIFGPNGEAERKYKILTEGLIETINKAIEAVSIEMNLDVVFTLQSGLGYIKYDYDITDKVLKYLDENQE